MWLIASVTVFLFGFAPRLAAPVSWGLFGGLLLLEFLWEIKVVGNNAFVLSPFSWVYPGVPVLLAPIVAMLLISGVFVGLGLVYFSHRDIIGE